jgi:serine protease AprX
MEQPGFLRAALDRFWELREREGRVHELKRQLEEVLRSEGARASLLELQELLVLLLYYGTGLEVREVAALRRSQVEPVEMGRFRARLARRAGPPLLQVLPAEASAVLRHLLERGDVGDLLLADSAGNAWSEATVLDIVQRHASGLLLGEAATEPTFFDHPVVLPTPTRLGAHPRHTGRGVVIAFVDSGFYAHPDLLTPRDRIRAHVDLTGMDRSLHEPHDDAWHGTMTTVACAGSGYLSNGLYRGIASEAELVLVAVGRQGRILPEDVVAALEWLLRHRERYGIRVVNISLGTDFPDSYRESAVDEAAELLVQAGVVVVAAAGNDPLRPSVPPANAPSVLTVGGLVDKNLPHEMTFVPYRSQYGTTVDGLTKPELCAPGALVAAPILPGTRTFDKARGLYFGRGLTDDDLRAELRRRPELGIDPRGLDDASLRARLEREVREMKLVGPHYQHVDGTSFAAPVVASVVAQMLEACPTLTPRAVRDLLIHTARPVPHIPSERQGYGFVQALAAVQAAESPSLPAHARRSAEPQLDGARVTFHFRGDAGRVAVTGSFNQWNREGLAMARAGDGRFEAQVDIPFPDRHTYKFIVDGQYWVEDEANPQNEPDGYGGVNSVFQTTEHHFADELQSTVFDALHGDTGEADRATARSVLDFALALPNAAWNSRVRDYHLRCLEHVIERLAAPGPASGVELFQLYNCGMVLRSATARIGLDVVTGRHVWGLDWPVPEELVYRLAESLDALLVTQRLPDHLDLDLVRGLLERGCPVVAPEEVHLSIGAGVLGMAAGAVRVLEAGGGLEVRAHRAAHWRDPDGRVAQRAYELRLDGCVVMHLADHDHTLFVDVVRRPDVLVATLGRFGPDADPTTSSRALVETVRPALLVPTHVAELGQPRLGEDGGYDAVARWLEGVDVPVRLLTWGESMHWPLP